MKFWKVKILSTKLKYKIMFCTLLISTAALLFITVSSYSYFAEKYEIQAKRDAQASVKSLSLMMESIFGKIVNDTVTFVSQVSVYNTLNDINHLETENYLYNYNILQTPIYTLGQCYSGVEKAVMIGKNGEFFGGSELGFGQDVSELSKWVELDSSRSVDVLSIRKSPFVPHNEVVPIIFSLAPFREFYTSLPHQREDSIANIFILLNAKKLEHVIQAYRKSDDMFLYIAAEDGTPINIGESSSLYEFAGSGEVKALIGEAETTKKDFQLNDNTYFLQTEDIGVFDLKLVSIISKNDLLKELSTVRTYIVNAWLFTLVMVIILSQFISRFMTRPLNKLMKIMKEMQENKFKKDFVPKYQDEIGLLGNQLLDMYDTIQASIEQVKEEEKQKAQAQMQLLAEQINPHFLYNTLECVHGEILNNEIKTSASMIESLGKYLRAGLNLGEDYIFFFKEIEHATEYVKLMNGRAHQEMNFSYEIEESLVHVKIAKCILQPLVENCMKHGFSWKKENSIIFRPAIFIEVKAKEGYIQIDVSDNGHGIDIKKANEAVHSIDEGKNHIGLGNIYRRLKFAYGDQVAITFSSIPYCKNTVTIKIPSL